MSDFSSALILAQLIHQRLSQDGAVQASLGSPPRLYDAPPEDPIFPYLTYDNLRSTDISGDNCELMSHTMNLHVWSRYAGRAEVMQILANIGDALERTSLESDSINLVSAYITYTDTFRGPDGRTLHGIVRFNATTQPKLETSV